MHIQGHKHIAVVVGSGRIGTQASIGSAPIVSVLAVIDMSQVYSPGQSFTPNLIGLLQLKDQNGNPVSGIDVKLNGSTALVATGTNVLLVNLTDPTQPTSAGQVTGTFGNWVALSDSGVLIGASNTASGSGIQAASLGSYIIIQPMPALPMVDDNGNTIEPIQLSVNAQGSAEDLQNAQAVYSEDGVQKTAIPLGNLRPGLQTVIIPPGLHMTSSSEIVTVSLMKPDGSRTPDVQLPLSAPNFSAASSNSTSGSTSGSTGSSSGSSSVQVGTIPLPPPFDTISPSLVPMGSGNTTVTITGRSAGSLTQAFVRGLDSQWHSISVTMASGITAQFTIPTSLLSQAGFLEVGPVDDDGTSIPLLVYDPSLPTLGTATNFEAQFVDNGYEGELTPASLTVGGENFTSGMMIVLGGANTPGFALPTTLLDSKSLQAQVPVPFAAEADDIFAAVLSADGTRLSTPIPYPRPRLVTVASSASPGDPDLTVGTISPGIDSAEAASVTRFAPSETGITSINGDLIETIGVATTQPQQYLNINGANLVDGMQVDFSTTKGGQVIHITAPLTDTQVVASLTSSSDLPPVSATSLMKSKVAVPRDIVDTKLANVQVKSSHAQSNLAVVSPDPPAAIPFGGRVSFQVYVDPGGEGHIEAVSRAPATYQPVTSALLSIAKSAPNSSGFPTIQLERESGDRSYFARIRGTALTQLPCGAIAVLNGYFHALSASSPPIACDPTPLPHAQLQAVVGGKVVTRDAASMPMALGKQYLEYDSLAQYYLDPAHFVPRIMQKS